MNERRRGDPRDPSHIEATLRLGNDVMASCIVENITVRGAKLRVDTDQPLPQHFELALPLFDAICDVRAVQLRWRIGSAAGVNFETLSTGTVG
jgi:hypothetical protein